MSSTHDEDYSIHMLGNKGHLYHTEVSDNASLRDLLTASLMMINILVNKADSEGYKECEIESMLDGLKEMAGDTGIRCRTYSEISLCTNSAIRRVLDEE